MIFERKERRQEFAEWRAEREDEQQKRVRHKAGTS